MRKFYDFDTLISRQWVYNGVYNGFIMEWIVTALRHRSMIWIIDVKRALDTCYDTSLPQDSFKELLYLDGQSYIITLFVTTSALTA